MSSGPLVPADERKEILILPKLGDHSVGRGLSLLLFAKLQPAKKQDPQQIPAALGPELDQTLTHRVTGPSEQSGPLSLCPGFTEAQERLTGLEATLSGSQGPAPPFPASLVGGCDRRHSAFSIYKMGIIVFTNFFKCVGLVNFRKTWKTNCYTQLVNLKKLGFLT